MSNFRRRLMIANQNKKPQYIKSGLVLYLDGIENTREGHNESYNGWQDLSGNNYDFSIRSGNTVNPMSNHYKFNNNSILQCGESNLMKLLGGVDYGKTIEVCCTIEGSGAQVIFLSSPYNSLPGTGLWYRSASQGLCVSTGISKTNLISDVNKPHTYSAFFDATFIDDVNVYQDNVLVNKSNSTGNMTNTNYVTIGGRTYDANYKMVGKIYCIRVYNRPLTNKERQHNIRVDKERFGI